MRLLKLRIENINSLKGVHEIDFTDAAYRSSGIFAITGPTGSGKTSILDAVTLALFGETPRMRARTTTAKKTDGTCMVMTKNSTRCSATALFECRGVFWRSTWSSRYRNKGRGTLVEEVELARLPDAQAAEGEVVATKKTAWESEMKRLLGLDFNAFTRSALLAQGAFAELLRAKGDERAQILENITGTGIYARIGRMVYERAGAERAAVERLVAQLESAAPLTEEERAALDKEAQAADAAAAEAQRARTEAEADFAWMKNVLEARGRDERARRGLDEVKKEAPMVERLRLEVDRAVKAAAPAQKRRERDVARDDEAKHRTVCALEEAAAKAAGEKLAAAEKNALEAAAAEEAARAQRTAALPEFEKMEAADRRIEVLAASAKMAADARRQAEEEGRRRGAELARAEKTAADAGAALAARKSELAAHAGDEALPERIAALEELARQMRRAAANAAAAVREVAVVEKDGAALKATKAKADQELDAAEKARAAAESAQAQAERAQKIAAAGTSVERQIAQTRELAGRLWAAEWLLECLECLQALAGETGAGAQSAAARLTARVDRLKGLYAELHGTVDAALLERFRSALGEVEAWSVSAGRAAKALDDANRALTAAERNAGGKRTAAADAEGRLNTQRGLWQRAKKQSVQLEGEWNEARRALIDAVAPFVPEGAAPGTDAELLDLLTDLRARADKRVAAVLEIQKSEKALEGLRARMEAAKTALAAADESARRAKEKDKAAMTALAEARSERAREWGARDAKSERATLDRALEAAALLRRQADAGAAEFAKAKESHAAKAEAEKKAADDFARRMTDAAEAFTALLAAAGFSSEDEVLAAERPAEFIASGRSRLSAHERALAAAEREVEGTADVLAKLLEAPRRDAPVEELDAAAQKARAEADAAAERKGALAARREADDERRRQSAEARVELERRCIAADRWGRLSALIGSADGKRFRKAAQRLTFALLLEQANAVLGQMGSRYELIASGDEGLDLAVRDQLMAGIERTSFNLSGGETFMVSLALALALSRISTKRMRVDTLFLDEGFGSLDPQSLERALTALEMLQQSSGKLIGLISHVGPVRERIPVRIEVHPRGVSGTSDLTGPGVRRIAEA
ncbi:AAA family ATPase [Sutterella sp.]|uniref:AAA family ATPase n=1 Tax=Sutterella sp. TaxID=1981025 RepID=UPI003FD85633